MTKKSIAKKPAKRKADQQAADRRRLAETLSSVLKNPETPTELYNGLADAITDMSEGVDFYTPEMIEACLIACEMKEQKRKGGAR